MFQFPDLSRVLVRGPFWTATVRVLQTTAATAAAGAPLRDEEFDRLIQSFLAPNLLPRSDADPDFQSTVIDGDPAIESDSTRTLAAVFKPEGFTPFGDHEFTGRMRFSDLANGQLFVLFRAAIPGTSGPDRPPDAFYRLGIDSSRRKPGAPQTPDLSFFLNGQTAGLPGDRLLNVTGRPDTWFRFKIAVLEQDDATTIQAKVWEEEQSEPDDFQLTATNTSAARPRSGSVGFMAGGGGRKLFGDLRVGRGASPAGTQFAVRTLFTDAGSDLPAGRVFVPHTITVVCEPLDVRIDNSPFHWTRTAGSGPVEQLGEDALKAALETGSLSLLLLSVDPASLGPGAVQVRGTCLAGFIDLGGMTDAGASAENLRAALLGPDEGVTLQAHAGGLSVRGRIRLPWDDAAPLGAAFLLEQFMPGPGFRLVLDPERLEPDEVAALLAKWKDLSAFVNPKSPQNSVQSDIPTPSWVTLEISNTSSLPRFFREWNTEPWLAGGELPPLTLAQGEFTVLLADQQPYNTLTPPTSLARVAPEKVSIRRVADGAGADRLEVEVNQSAAAAPAGVLRYQAGRTDGAFSERFTVTGVELAYDAVETARQLRRNLGVSAPDWIADDGIPVDPPLLWGFMPLEDGWAQLPFANLTEKIYLDAGLAGGGALESGPRSAALAVEPAALSFGGIAGGVDPPPQTLAVEAGGDSLQWIATSSEPWLTVDPPSGTGNGSITVTVSVAGLASGTRTAAIAVRPADEPEAQVQAAVTLTVASAVQGVVSFSNDHPDVLKRRAEQHAWRLTVLSGARSRGLWTFTAQTVAAGVRFEPASVEFEVDNPELALEGLLWLSSGRPTAQDALPDLANWVNGIYPVALRTVKPGLDLFPAPLTFAFGADGLSFSAAADARLHADLNRWTFTYSARTGVLSGFEAKNVLPAGVLSATPPLIWRRHARLPMIQALPLTQSLTPPNYPAASRQLAPFAPAAAEAASWSFGVEAAGGAARFPSFLSEAGAAREWSERSDLPLASLSLPGVFLDAAGGLTPQYRFDLPYSDEIHALAQLPKAKPAPPAESPEDPAIQPPEALVRETFEPYWRELSTKASLAAADAVNAFSANNGDTAIEHLIEGFQWRTTATLELDEYPGSLALDAQPVDSLGGISGRFTATGSELQRVPDGVDAPDAFEIVSGSMAARMEQEEARPLRLRDQAGLLRAATVTETGMLRTPLELGGQQRELVSLRAPETLKAQPLDWLFWFRDLPFEAAPPQPDAPGFSGTFERDSVRSPQAADTDVNDPEALAAVRNHLNGYEWRLGMGSDAAALALGRLRFYPLTLEKVVLANGALERVEVIGRLQLPLAAEMEIEQTDFSNAVRLVFQRDAAGVTLEAAQLESEAGEWPLALNRGVITREPLLLWSGVSLGAGALEITGAKLMFFLFDEEWTVELPALSFALGAGAAAGPIVVPLTVPPPQAGLFSKELTVTLDLGGLRHSASLLIKIQLGKDDALAFGAEARFHLLKEDGSMGAVEWASGHLFRGLPLRRAAGEAFVLETGRALEFSWSSHSAAAGVQLFPGMQLQGAEARGFAAVTFGVAPAAGAVPSLTLQSAHLEALVPCAWGTFLQNQGGFGATERQVFGSSAGDLVLGYTGALDQGEWRETFLLNGCLEVKSLISWPAAMSWDDSRRVLKLPQRQPSLPHFRHSMRVLFNQHPAPVAALAPAGDGLLFTLKADATWQFLAVVEHQIVELETNFAGSALASSVRSDRRWTALQEVRIVPPTVFREFLIAHRDSPQPDSSDAAAPADYGYLRPALRDLLIAELPNLAENTLLVEAGAVHFIKQIDIASGSATTLQFLPGGSQQAILGNPADFETRALRWLLLTTPFLGRLQAQNLDFSAAALQADPVLTLALNPPAPLLLALTSWGGLQDVEINVPAPDGPVTHSWPRIDPLTLEENLFRLQKPLPEPRGAATLESVMAALPDTPARFSRPAALRRVYDSRRRGFPPVEIDPAALAELDETGPIVWRKRSRMVLEGAAGAGGPDDTPYGWHLAGLQLLQSLGIDSSRTDPVRRYAAVTVLPAERESNPTPVSYAVSPYLGLQFLPKPSEVTALLVSTELLCLDGGGGRLQAVATRLWEPAAGLDSEIDAWARQTARLLAPESPLAIVRRRDVNRPATPEPGRAPITASYSFTLVSGIRASRELTKRTFRIRAAVAQLRFREAAYAGARSPDSVQPFELAPPQVAGVQPIRLLDRPAGAEEPAEWPFGWSGLRISILYGKDRRPAIGFDPSRPNTGMTLWWQAPHYIVQFRSAAGGRAAVAGLPAEFRAPAIPSLRPVAVNPPLPALRSLAATLAEWQPVLPGTLRYSLAGDRAGVMLALRHHLVRQTGSRALRIEDGVTTVSGSVPVHHRVPRPVPLPDNRFAETALQPWASALEPRSNALVTAAPAGEAFFAAVDGRPASRRLMILSSPPLGAIDAAWNGELQFVLSAGVGTVSVEIVDGPETVAYAENDDKFQPADAVKVRSLVEKKRPGDVLNVLAKVSRGSGEDFSQVLRFPLRVTDPVAPRLPLTPFFVQFEDPEYNRQLASSPARASQSGAVGDLVRTFTLAADRQMYNPDSIVNLRFDRDDRQTVNGQLTVTRIDVAASPTVLIAGEQMRSGRLKQIALPVAVQERPVPLTAGDTLLFKLDAEGIAVTLRVDIVAEPVVPLPQAAYGLLRLETIGGQDQVECVRFAWGPAAARVELVAPEDLQHEVVRRRAVFQWTDTARTGMLVSQANYAIQKIAANGSTHFPRLPALAPR